jgi:hypothetical protein
MIRAIFLSTACLIMLIIFGMYYFLPMTGLKRVNRFNKHRNSADLRSGSIMERHRYLWKQGSSTNEQSKQYDVLIDTVTGLSQTVDAPSVPTISTDRHLLILSASASRLRYGGSVTFTMVFPTRMKSVLPKNTTIDPMSANDTDMWCVFDDGSITPVYVSDVNSATEEITLLDCPLTDFGRNEIWQHKRTLRIHLATRTPPHGMKLILKGFFQAPVFSRHSSYLNPRSLTLCTSSVRNAYAYLTEWIEFHRAVGFDKFVIYNTSDIHNRLPSILSDYNRKYPNMVDVIQWNFSSLGLTDWFPRRYFQIEALHDCFIRYSDQSDWIGTIDLDEYIVPMPPYDTVATYLTEKFARNAVGSLNLKSLFFCDEHVTQSDAISDHGPHRLLIERWTLRAKTEYNGGREKFLYRPRFIQHLGIHRQVNGLYKAEPDTKEIRLAHYISMLIPRSAGDCTLGGMVNDTSIRDRFSERIQRAISALAE